ncbi:NAD(P)-dependent dehydrogenase (short-subunit alcohol dehydrogenase family) [Xanthomonas arboricola]|uniref:SDR family NAD(P)-dependent oxidoreductase n=1 Tax=Xanthomonas euroxanthea TaxID=2259622 RepID=UPI0016A0B8C4|nr:SDR family NAD(P)-dependent oxidoreductase [Xanthomonas euroxanthea]NJC36679.1 NAD(P)-dependent dehydrogenase (short-subunit alcohol dehydrogenase family) [Xanthomonas euroxanthea]
MLLDQSGFTETDVPNQAGKCFIVTGANAGVGFEISRVLAARGARVLLGCREQGRADAAIARIKRLTPGADLAWLPLDLGDLDSVRAAAAHVLKEPRIDVLINNAGIMNPPLMRTKQGFESQFGVNHLGVFALTSLLLPKLAETPGSRVVVTSSIAHLKATLDWDDLNAERSYSKGDRYGASKLANALFFFETGPAPTRDPVAHHGCRCPPRRGQHQPGTAHGSHPGDGPTCRPAAQQCCEGRVAGPAGSDRAREARRLLRPHRLPRDQGCGRRGQTRPAS